MTGGVRTGRVRGFWTNSNVDEKSLLPATAHGNVRSAFVMEAYILVKIATQREVYGFNRSVAQKLRSMEGVESAVLLFGDYDAIVKLNVPKIHDCENLVIEEISTIDGVQSTVTLLCIDEEMLE
jgi:DNA-binding Lrp family transcriptional regulator